jgi:Family of unknown function (DUF6464)
MRYNLNQAITIDELIDCPDILGQVLSDMRRRVVSEFPIECTAIGFGWQWHINMSGNLSHRKKGIPSVSEILNEYRVEVNRGRLLFGLRLDGTAIISLSADGVESMPRDFSHLGRSLYPTDEYIRDRITIPRHRSNDDEELKARIANQFYGQAVTPVQLAQMEALWGGRITVDQDGCLEFHYPRSLVPPAALQPPADPYEFLARTFENTRRARNTNSILPPEQRENRDRLNTCAFASGDPRLKCAVNPTEECRSCSHYEEANAD